jgi:hypothetical protein
MEFFGLDRREARKAELLFTEVNLRAGEHIAWQDGVASQLLILIDAEADVLRDGRTVARLGRGETSGEISMTGRSTRMTADVVVTRSGKALAAGRSDVARLDHRGRFYRELARRAEQRSAELH